MKPAASPPHRVGTAVATVVVEPDGLAHFEFVAQYQIDPVKPARLFLRGLNLHAVECQSSNTEKPWVLALRGLGSWRHGRAGILVYATQPAECAQVTIRYSLRLQPYVPAPTIGHELDWSHLPWLRSVKRPAPPESSPFLTAPDTLVRVRVPPGFTVLGPQHTTMPSPATGDEFVFSGYEGLTPFFLIIGRFSSVAEGSRFVLIPENTPLPPALIDMVLARVHAVRSHFETFLGPAAVVHRSLLLFLAPDAPSTCLGSSLLINAAKFATATHPEALATDTLAHEYAHTWWEYSVFWSQDIDDWRSEAFANGFARDCVMALEGMEALQQLRDYDWACTMSVLKASRRKLNRRKSWTALHAGLLLSELMRRGGREVADAFQALWADAGRTPASRERIAETVSRMVSPAVAGAISHALDHPLPVRVRARIVRVSGADWALELRARPADLQVLARRLDAVQVKTVGVNDGRALRITMNDPSQAAGIAYMLEPTHLVTERTACGLGLGFTPPTQRLWQWSAVARQAKESKSFVAWLRDSFWGLIVVMIHPESPTGWQVLARAARRVAPPLADRLEIAAGSRATFYGEEPLIARMVAILRE